jgi:high-affinity Fe2+/Pb2+ permease
MVVGAFSPDWLRSLFSYSRSSSSVSGSLKYFLAPGLCFSLGLRFSGNGVKELQAAGWFSATPLRFPPQVPWPGVPNTQTLTDAIFMLLASGVSVAGRQREH